MRAAWPGVTICWVSLRRRRCYRGFGIIVARGVGFVPRPTRRTRSTRHSWLAGQWKILAKPSIKRTCPLFRRASPLGRGLGAVLSMLNRFPCPRPPRRRQRWCCSVALGKLPQRRRSIGLSRAGRTMADSRRSRAGAVICSQLRSLPTRYTWRGNLFRTKRRRRSPDSFSHCRRTQADFVAATPT